MENAYTFNITDGKLQHVYVKSYQKLSMVFIYDYIARKWSLIKIIGTRQLNEQANPFRERKQVECAF